MPEIGFVLLGIAAGILSGLFGIGGGIVMVPALIFLFGMGILDANATSLSAMLLPVGILGVWQYYKAGLVHLKQALWISVGLLAGSFVGGELAININEAILTSLYTLVLVYVALSYFDIGSFIRKKKPVDDESVATKHMPGIVYILTGLGAGVFAGMFGKGGGIIIVPLLIGVFRYSPKSAVATSLAALQLPVGLPSVLVYAQAGHFHLTPVIYIALGIVAGSLLGALIGVTLRSSLFKRIYALFLLVVAVYMLANLF